MSTYDNVHKPLLKLFPDFRDFLRRPHPADVFNVAREVLETVPEGIVMLECQYCGRNEDRNLLVVGDGLEGSPDSQFGLSEAHVSAHQPVHGTLVLHIRLDGLGRSFLVRSVLVHE